MSVVADAHHPGVFIDTEISKDTHPFYFRHYGQLVGKKIKNVQIENYQGGALAVLVFEDGPLHSASVMCDPEGNGPGHLDIVRR